jgi:hypothetical protein
VNGVKLARYKIMEYDEALTLWCEDCHWNPTSPDYEGWVEYWSDRTPVPVYTILAAACQHEEGYHSPEREPMPDDPAPDGDPAPPPHGPTGGPGGA